jgi:hypothetical protein
LPVSVESDTLAERLIRQSNQESSSDSQSDDESVYHPSDEEPQVVQVERSDAVAVVTSLVNTTDEDVAEEPVAEQTALTRTRVNERVRRQSRYNKMQEVMFPFHLFTSIIQQSH